MTRDTLTIARWKCAFLAKKIAVLREAGSACHIVASIKRHQSELDQLIAVIERDCAAADADASAHRSVTVAPRQALEEATCQVIAIDRGAAVRPG